MTLCIHHYEKTSKEPVKIYYDYNGWKIGIFTCKCIKCGKLRDKKFLADKQLGELMK